MQTNPYEIGSWTRVIQFLLIVGMGLSLASIVLILDMSDAAHPSKRSKVAELREKAAFLSVVAVAQVLVGAVAGLAVLAWTYNAYCNLSALDADTRFSPLMALLLCLIPVLNIITFYLVLDEIWRQSDPGRLNLAERSRKVSGIVLLWFVVTLATVAAVTYSILMRTLDPKPQDPEQAALVAFGILALGIAQSALLFWIVGTVFVNQMASHHVMSQRPNQLAVSRVPEFPGDAALPDLGAAPDDFPDLLDGQY